jgi:hypothetical protein
MEYDSQFSSQRRSKLVSRLRPETVRLIEKFAQFYAIEPDQLIDTAVTSLLLEDKIFVEHIRVRGRTEALRQI